MNAPASNIKAASAGKLSGAAIMDAVKSAGVEYVLSVPDITTSQGLLKPTAEGSDFKLVRVCKEDECLGIAAGLTYGDKRSLILIQHTGFLYAMNAIRGVAIEQKLPAVFMVGLLAKEPDVAPTKSKRYGIRIMEPVIDALGMERIYIDTDADVPKIAPAIRRAYETSTQIALLIGRSPS
jgi:sulfopyruvate decarboxylase subunit alpha